MDMQQAKSFCDDLRMVGIEAIPRAWGRDKSWVCIKIGKVDFLWHPDGHYDGWEVECEGLSDTEVQEAIDFAEKKKRKEG